MPVNCFTNQDDALLDDGYDSEGALPLYDDLALDETAEHYEEEAISSGLALPPPAAAHASISEAMVVMLNVADLKNELKKRGKVVSGKKLALVLRLTAVIRDGSPIQEEGAVVRGAHLNGVYVTAHWHLLTKNPTPIDKPTNKDASLRPPKERDVPINPKYGYDEQFYRAPFLGTTKSIAYSINPPVRKRKGKNLSPTRMQRTTVEIVSREEGGPNKHFLRKHGLDEHSHPMDWFNALLPQTPKDNHEKLKDINVNGDGKKNSPCPTGHPTPT